MTRPVRVIILGSNPSKSSPDDSPFHPDTQSRQIVDSWLAKTGLTCEVIYLNVCNYKKVNNAPLLTREIVGNLSALQKSLSEYKGCKIVTVGNAANIAVSRLKIEHFKCPHPSKRNRIFNDKGFLPKMIEDLKEYVSNK